MKKSTAKKFEVKVNGTWIVPEKAVLHTNGKWLFWSSDGKNGRAPPACWRRVVGKVNMQPKTVLSQNDNTEPPVSDEDLRRERVNTLLKIVRTMMEQIEDELAEADRAVQVSFQLMLINEALDNIERVL